MEALVAGVPSPRSRIASRISSSSSSFPAVSIAPSNVASLNRVGGFVFCATSFMPAFEAFSPTTRRQRDVPSSSESCSLPYTAIPPAS
ncbi:hypothetical protein G6F50_018041 [Rhizopus delemar]|uniref:Uncharacterized protein n=1 Tax=Rhizopus delemar TaxID=936053 RepID=A0A9P7BZG8_9FUNG|nr:hypothetical protein G6F50_018041 [Rhizopus delemar]